MLKETGKGNLDELGLEVYTVGADEEGMDSDEEERMDEENGQVEETWWSCVPCFYPAPRVDFWLFCRSQEGLPVQMEVTLEDMTEEEEFESDTIYGKEHVGAPA